MVIALLSVPYRGGIVFSRDLCTAAKAGGGGTSNPSGKPMNFTELTESLKAALTDFLESLSIRNKKRSKYWGQPLKHLILFRTRKAHLAWKSVLH